MKFLNFRKKTSSDDINDLFPDWRGAGERVAVFSPHDDDAVIGAGYAIEAAMQNGGEVYIAIFCNGDMGYTDPADKDIIMERRRGETRGCYAAMGIPEENIVYMGYNDFAVWPFLGKDIPSSDMGSVIKTVDFIRQNAITRVLLPNGWREHLDHEAVYRIGAYDVMQAGDPIISDHGDPQRVLTYLQYSVWSDFSPSDSLTSGGGLRANRAICAETRVEEKVGAALRKYVSQGKIIDGLVQARRERESKNGFVELYIDFDPRPKLDFTPYIEEVDKLI